MSNEKGTFYFSEKVECPLFTSSLLSAIAWACLSVEA